MKRTSSGRISRPVAKESVVDSASSEDEIEEMDTPDENPAKYCRLCFSIAQPLVPIFNSPHDQGGFLAQLVRESMTIPLSAKDDYPSSLCRECFQRLQEFQRFRELFHTLNQVVCRKRQALKNPTSSKKKKKKGAKSATAIPTVSIPVSNIAPVVDSTTNGTESNGGDCIELSDEDGDENPVIGNGPSAETAEDMDDDQPYISMPDDWFCCRLCNRMFQTLAIMMDHFRDNHPGTVRVYNVPPASVPTPSVATSTASVDPGSIVDYSQILQEVMVDNVRYFKCNDCDTMLRQKRNLANHWERFHRKGGAKKIYCGVSGCTRFFMESKSYRRHLSIHHGVGDPTKINHIQMQLV